jgi:hypothetical protein
MACSTFRNVIALVSLFIAFDQMIYNSLSPQPPTTNQTSRGQHFFFPVKEQQHRMTNDVLGHIQQRFLREYISPHATGWVPSEFPNPLHSPAQCHIDSVGVGGGGGVVKEEDPQGESSYSQQQQQQEEEEEEDDDTSKIPPRLLFCDPDGIFSDEGVMQISYALRNFTSRYDDSTRKKGPCRTANKRKSTRFLLQDIKKYYIHEQDGEWMENQHSIPMNRIDENRVLRPGAALHSVEKRGTVSMFGTSFQFDSDQLVIQPEIAVAIVSKMDLPDILHEFSFYTFEDEEDMINDAAQYFASYLHNAWFGRDRLNEDDQQGSGGSSSSTSSFAGHVAQDEKCKDRDYYMRSEANGILIFISVADRVCFISSGSAIASVLPWWRLERVVSGMKDDMRSGDYFQAISSAINNIAQLLDEGPPTVSEKTVDFLRRFGVVLLFSSITFFLAICGEYRDRKKRYEEAEFLSEMDGVERDKARILQREFKTDSCPICLESFHNVKDGTSKGLERGMTRVDSYGIPIKGNDGKDLKILRCGHIFDYTCWRCWITSSSCGDPGICPVCRANITRKRRERDGDRYDHEVLSNSNDEIQTDSYGTFQNETRRRPPLLDESISSVQSSDEQANSYILIL